MHPKLATTPHPTTEQCVKSEEEWLEYDTTFKENKTIFNYKIKKHGDKQDEYKSNCIKVTEMLWRKCSKQLRARIKVELK